MKRLVSIILSMLIVVSAIGVLPVLAEEKATSENFLDIFKANSTLCKLHLWGCKKSAIPYKI